MDNLATNLQATDEETGFEFSDPVDWIQTNYWIPETRSPIVLPEYQQIALREALRMEDGLFVYSTVIWSDIKKSAKSSLAAAVAMWFAFHTQYGEIYAVANDLKQADSRVAHYFRRSLDLNPNTRNIPKHRGYTTRFPWGTIFEALPIDPAGEAGGNPDLVIFSELWGAHEKAKQSMWTEMTTPPTKFGRAMRWVETYAGYTGESILLERQYHVGQQGEKISEDPPMWSNKSARMFMMWNQTPKCPWQVPAYYIQQEAELLPNEFRRIHRNEWVSSEDVFVYPEWWHSCFRADPVPERRLEPWVIAIDAGTHSDNFAIVGVTRHPTNPEETIVRYARRWIPPKGGLPDFSGPEKELRRLIDEHNVVQIAYDRYQLHDMMGRMKQESLVWLKEFSQNKDRLTADSDLRKRIMRRLIHQFGNEELTEHIINANAKIDEIEDRKIRIVKRAAHMKVDLAVALSMADFECMRLNL